MVGEDKTFTVFLPEEELYMSAHVVDENGFAPYYIIEKGREHKLKVDTDYALILFRTEILDRRCEEVLRKAHTAQDKSQVTRMMEDSSYKMPNYDQEQLGKLRGEYKAEWLKAGGTATYARGPGRVDQHTLNLSHAAGWGGMEPELHVSNAYYTSETMSGDVARAITFEDPKNKFFTSFTLYDEDGYLMEGETHINSKMWKPNPDGTITINFNAKDDAINSLSSRGKPFNYVVRNYGVSQLVVDGKSKPFKPEVVKD